MVQHRLAGDEWFGSLPKVFIASAFVNFIVGASLGGWMAVDPSVWATIASLHGEINPFGWLTMLIYGMTYAVLAVSAGIVPPKAWVGWLHFALAESAVVITVAGLVAQVSLLVQVGLAIQFAAPVVFLANILTAVFSSRRARRQGQDNRLRADSSHPLSALQRGTQHQQTDHVGQRGTDTSLMLFLLGTAWMLLHTFGHPGQTLTTPLGASYVIYYGWIAGTILAVALHLFPRFVGNAKVNGTMASAVQAVWGIAVVGGAAGYIWSPILASIGARVLGVPFVWFSVVYLRLLLAHRISAREDIRVPLASRIAWVASWLFCFVLGCGLILGLDPLSLAAMHMLFLGFATTLVYGIGYTLFPHVLNRVPPAPGLAVTQVLGAVTGAVLMVIAFVDLSRPQPQAAFILLAIGGTLAGLGAITFLVLWPFAQRITRESPRVAQR